jgi:hypothetical protein
VKKAILVSAVLSSSFLMLVPAGTATTQPAVQVTIKVKVTDTAMTLSTRSARRGWGAHFVVQNLGHKPHVFEIGGLKSKVIPPGGRATVSASLDERGKFPYKVVLNAAGPAHRGVFTVF